MVNMSLSRHRHRCLRWLLLSVPALLLTAAEAIDGTLIWSSTGGGWRSMVANMGLANVLGQAGILSTTSSSVSAIATNSGASWFALQFLYSPVFFQRTLTSSPSELGAFVTQWMRAYRDIFANVPNDPTCGFSGSNQFLLQQLLGDACDIFVYFGVDWANFTQVMLDQVALDYGDAGLANRTLGVGNRVKALQNTDLMIQTALATSARTLRRSEGGMPAATTTFLGPADAQGRLFATPLTVQYTVTTDGTGFVIAGETAISVYTAPSPENFTLRDYEPFFLYPPPPNATLTIAASSAFGNLGAMNLTGRMREPFAGTVPTVAQVAGPSSAALGALSGLLPTLLAQANSVALNSLGQDNTTDPITQQLIRSAFSEGLNQLYNSQLAHGVAVCMQWPDPCTDRDSYFVDGAYTDAASLALTIGQFHQSGGDLDAPLKVLLVNTNELFSDDSFSHPLLAYFSNPENENIAPGSYHWPEGLLPGPSMQIFQDYLDEDNLSGLVESIPEMNLTTAVIKTTTIDNEAYGVLAGQTVNILLIDLNAAIPTVIVGEEDVDRFLPPLSRLVVDISSSSQLLDRIQSFASFAEVSNAAAPTKRILASFLGIFATSAFFT